MTLRPILQHLCIYLQIYIALQTSISSKYFRLLINMSTGISEDLRG